MEEKKNKYCRRELVSSSAERVRLTNEILRDSWLRIDLLYRIDKGPFFLGDKKPYGEGKIKS